MTSLTVITTQSVEDILERVEGSLPGAVESGALLGAEHAAGELRREIAITFGQRTGKLGRSFPATLLASGRDQIRAGAISDLAYARIQDKGGTITPKRAKALTVPFSDKAKSLSANGLSAREFPTPLSLVWKKGADRGRLIEKRGKHDITHYLLRKSVKIKPTGYIDRAAKAAGPEIAIIMDTEIGKKATEAADK